MLLFLKHLINTTGAIAQNDIIALILFLLIIIYWLYICRTLFIIFKENCKAIAVNHDERKIILFDRKNNINIIPFEDIEHINISKGEIIRGITLGQISLLTKSGIIYRITISKTDEFYGEVAKDFSININESIFFNAKSNNHVDDVEKNNSILNNIKTLIILVLIVAGICARFYKSMHVMDRIKSNTSQASTVSNFDYNDFADNMAEQAKSLVPNDISVQDKTYIVEKIRNNTYIAAESLVKDSAYNFSDEQILFISQVIAEWTFHKTVDLARSGIPSQYWDDIIQKISFTIYEVAKQSIIKQISQEELLQVVEYNVMKVYKQSIEALAKDGLIDTNTKKNAEMQSNIDKMVKEAQKKK